METIQQQSRAVTIAAAAVCAVYFPTAFIVGKSYVAPAGPPGAVQPLFRFERVSPHGFGYLSRIPGFHFRPEIVLYEDGKPLPGPANSTLREIDQIGRGRYAHETGAGFFLSASDNSNPRTNHRDYWAVIPPPQQR